MENISQPNDAKTIDYVDNYILRYGLQDFEQDPTANDFKAKLEPVTVIPSGQEILTNSIGHMSNLLNVAQMYYQKIKDAKNKSMFDDITDQMSTNLQLESLYKLMEEYAENLENAQLIKVYDPNEVNTTKFKEFYVLEIDNENVKGCPLVLPLLRYLSTIEWYNIEWNIYQINPESDDTGDST